MSRGSSLITTVMMSLTSLVAFRIPTHPYRSASQTTTGIVSSTMLRTHTDIIPISAERMVELGLNIEEYPDDDYSHILGIDDDKHTPSKLQKICQIRMQDVAHSKLPVDVQGCGIDRSFYVSEDDLIREIEDFDLEYGRPLNLIDRIKATYPKMAIAAEFKRASPSKGDINMGADIIQQCSEYAAVGSAVISILTEYKHFKGTLNDMKRVRISTQKQMNDKRPAILRKDFILDRYQVLEARANGADTLLLIVAVLGVTQLRDLISCARSLGMEPLVEVHTTREMNIALDCGARVIGVNNRNLHSFHLDLQTTSRAISVVADRGASWRPGAVDQDLLVFALSGITSAEDVTSFSSLGVSCCLIGETLMKSDNPAAMVRELLGESAVGGARRPMVKICGVTRVDDAATALQMGANLIGLIFAPASPRKVTSEQAKAVASVVQRYGERTSRLSLDNDLARLRDERLSPADWFSRASLLLDKTSLRRPLVVGVFQDQSVEEINDAVEECGLDLVQLHGSESLSHVNSIIVPCIKVLHVPANSTPDEVLVDLNKKVAEFADRVIAIILDTSIRGDSTGGTGVTFDWKIAEKLGIQVFLAGGISPSNVVAARQVTGAAGLDVSSGVEVSPGVKDQAKMAKILSK